MRCRLFSCELKPCMESPAGEYLSTVLVVTNFLAIPANRRGPHAAMAAPPAAYFAESHSLPLENLRPAWVIRFKHFFWSLDLRSCLWFEPFSDVAGWDVKHNMFSPTIRSLKRTCVCRLKRPLDYRLDNQDCYDPKRRHLCISIRNCIVRHFDRERVCKWFLRAWLFQRVNIETTYCLWSKICAAMQLYRQSLAEASCRMICKDHTGVTYESI